MKEKKIDFLEDEVFKIIIDNTPLVSIDLIIKNENKILLGKRVNKPAQKYWFTLGGRVLKNEKIESAIHRIAEMELGFIPNSEPKFIGVFEHIYEDGIYENSSTHYLNLGYEVNISELHNLPKEQHHEYKWFSIEELLKNDQVHNYVKDYFLKEMGTVPQNKKV